MASNMISLAPTPLQKIYEQTCLDLVRDLSKDLVKDTPTADSYTSINGLGFAVEEINFTSGVEKLMKKYHNPHMQRNGNGKTKAWNRFPAKLEITKVGDGNLSINQAKAMVGEIYKESKDTLYGVLLMDVRKGRKRQIVNLLHPVVVHNLNSEDLDYKQDEEKWTMAIYSFKDGMKKELKELYPSVYNKENYVEDIANVLAAIDTPSLYYVENKDFQVDIQNDQFVLNYNEVKTMKDSGLEIKESGKTGRNYIVPGQIINISGVAYPYYGVIYSTKGLAWNLCPMMGANIAHPEGQSTGNGMGGGSRICTHSGDSRTQAGVSSLNHCNTTSPLNSDCMEPGSMTYAENCMAASIELLLGEEYATGIAGGQSKALTFQEFVKENDGATKKQYLKYIKDRIAHTMAQTSGEMVAKPIVQTRDIYDQSLWKQFVSGGEDVYVDGTISHVGKGRDPKMKLNGGWHNLDSTIVNEWLKNNRYVGIEQEDVVADILAFVVGQGYEAGDRVTEEGYLYQANRATRLRPERGSRAWRMIEAVADENTATVRIENQTVPAYGTGTNRVAQVDETPVAPATNPFNETGVPLTEEERELRAEMQRAQVVA